MSILTRTDSCINYLTEIDAVYLCIDDVIIYHTSMTGLKKDYKWHNMSIQACCRIVSARYEEVQAPDVMRALQELDVIYDTAIKSEGKTPSNIFNYNSKYVMDKEELVISSLIRMMIDEGIRYLQLSEYMEVIDKMNNKLNIRSTIKRNHYIRKHLEDTEYIFREDRSRMAVKRNKITMICHQSVRSIEIVRTRPMDNIINKLKLELL